MVSLDVHSTKKVVRLCLMRSETGLTSPGCCIFDVVDAGVLAVRLSVVKLLDASAVDGFDGEVCDM